MSPIFIFRFQKATACLAVLLVFACVASVASGQVRADLSSLFLARGEQAMLEVTTLGHDAEAAPIIPEIPGVEIRPTGYGTQARNLPGRVRAYTQQFVVSSYATGLHTIPALELVVRGNRARTSPIEFQVFDPDELQWQEATAGGRTIRYGSIIRTLRDTVYEGEKVPVEIKLYVPRDLVVEDWGIPEFQVDGVAAWRFEPSRMRSQVNLLGQPYFALGYPSTMTATRSGAVAVGPASVRLTTVQVVMERFARREFEQIFLSVPKLELESLALPAGAPRGFENAVGDFKLRVSVTETEVREGDPVAVDIVVTGSGNLDTLRAPRLVDDDGWRTYDATAVDRGSERTEIAGTVAFRQFLRPLELKGSVPSYQLVFFNPATKTYEVLRSEPIALEILPGGAGAFQSSAPPPAVGVPVEKMTDILAILRPATLTLPAAPMLPGWWPHVLGALFAMALAIRGIYLRCGHWFRRDPRMVMRQRAFREFLAAMPEDEGGFLRASGAFIERWLPDVDDPVLTEVISERDARCFRPDAGASAMGRDRRARIVSALRRWVTKAPMAVLMAMLVLMAGGSRVAADETPGHPMDVGRAAIEAYEAARFDEAARLWLTAGPYEALSPDTLYNIGNASYRLGSPGHAALFYRRALARDPGHHEARQNLRFIERKVGAITIQRPDYQHVLARTPFSLWTGLVACSAWVLVISILVFPATHAGSGWRIPAIVGLVSAPLLASAGALGWRYYPNDAEFAPLERQAVVIMAETTLHTEASRTAPEVIEAPPGSLIEIIRVSGQWAYVAFASGTRGWIPMEAFETIIPDGEPELPALKKPRADSRSA
jgi:hypothetical protein